MSDPMIQLTVCANDRGQQTGIITLDRPNALNALSFSMITQLHDALLQWQDDDRVQCVIIGSDLEKAFCAGGDIRALYASRELPMESRDRFFEIEYDINRIIYHYPKPYVALMNGITMGGGVGVSLHGTHSVASNCMQLAMPEAVIGFFPDIGAMHPLSRLPHAIGLWMALTGLTIGAGDALALDLVKGVVPYSRFDALRQALIAADLSSSADQTVTEIIRQFHQKPKDAHVWQRRHDIEAVFDAMELSTIHDRLAKFNDPWWQATQNAWNKNSPYSLQFIMDYYEQAQAMTMDDVLAHDLIYVKQFLQGHNFMEGIRARVIDKDHQPHWQDGM